MDSTDIESQQEASEVGAEVMESISLSDPVPSEVESVGINGIRKNCFIQTEIVGNAKKFSVEFRQKVSEIRSSFEDQWLHYCSSGHSERTRAYHVWPGNHVFFLGGRLMCGPNPRGLLLTTFSITLSSWTFSEYVADDFPHHSGHITAFSMIITIIVLTNLIRVSMFDPGIIPRNELPTCEAFGRNVTFRKRKLITVEIKLKYCQVCKIYRPARSCHCLVCDNCVENFDHHCPWIGQCIGLRNHRFYVTFLFAALLLFVYIFCFSCQRIQPIMSQSSTGMFQVLKNRPELLALVIFSIIVIVFVFSLACYNVYLIVMNQTAYENFRQRYASSKNPYDKGIFCNIKEALFTTLPPPRINFREEVESLYTKSSSDNLLNLLKKRKVIRVYFLPLEYLLLYLNSSTK